MIITPVQVRFCDLDPKLRVNNTMVAAYLELGRLDFCKKLLGVNTLDEIPFSLVRIELDLLQSIPFNVPVEVRTTVSKIGNKSWEFDALVIHSETNIVYSKAKTVQVYFDYIQFKSIEIPDSVRDILKRDMDNSFQKITSMSLN